MAITEGTLLGHYRVLAALGAGGMGEVLRARDTRLGREVALKVLPEDLALDGDRLDRLQREARAIAAISHPGIVTVHAIEEFGIRSFIVMELVEGRELGELIPEEGLPLAEVLSLALQLVRALAAAHRGGVLHRDLKPANVMVTETGQLKVLDFGLAKFRSGAEPVDEGEATAALTQAGTVLGTVPYMSPEQLRGSEIDERSDLFSVGVLLYEMATGDRPFAGDSPPELMSSILRDEPVPVQDRRPALPRQLGRIVRRCLEKEPARRYGSADDLLYDLEGLREESSEQAALDDGGSVSLSSSALEPSDAGPSSAISDDESGHLEQEIRYCTTADDVSIAYATVGEGPPLVRSLGWFTHLEMEWKWQLGREFWERLARRHLLVRYDGRGMGLSETEVEDMGLEKRLLDLEAVVDAAGLERFALMGMSEGGQTAIAYAARHPERVSHLVLYGTFRDNKHLQADREKWRGLMQLMKSGWGQETPVFRQIFTHLFLGTEASADQIRYFNEMQRASASPETALAFLAATGRVDVLEEAAKIRCPTLVVHRRGDLLVPFEAGRKLAASIPGARFLPMEGDNHWLLLRDPGVEEYAEALESFLAEPGGD
jgi:serine/threonine protein kinase/alpha-beta hydrolase superfamily lysophospholipase